MIPGRAEITGAEQTQAGVSTEGVLSRFSDMIHRYSCLLTSIF